MIEEAQEQFVQWSSELIAAFMFAATARKYDAAQREIEAKRCAEQIYSVLNPTESREELASKLVGRLNEIPGGVPRFIADKIHADAQKFKANNK
jgi:hypothetical protein